MLRRVCEHCSLIERDGMGRGLWSEVANVDECKKCSLRRMNEVREAPKGVTFSVCEEVHKSHNDDRLLDQSIGEGHQFFTHFGHRCVP